MRILIECCLGVLLIACGDSMDATAEVMDAESAAPLPPDQQCPADTEEFRATEQSGLLQMDATQNFEVRLVSANWVPPAKDFNDWTIAVTDMNGTPMPNAQINWACAWMPAHGHGSNPKQINKLGDGRFELFQQNLSMYGGWQVKLWIDPDGGSVDYQPQSAGSGLSGTVCTPSNGTAGTQNIEFDVCVPRMRGSS